MIKITRNVGIRGRHYSPGDFYEGNEERKLVGMGKATVVVDPPPVPVEADKVAAGGGGIHDILATVADMALGFNLSETRIRRIIADAEILPAGKDGRASIYVIAEIDAAITAGG